MSFPGEYPFKFIVRADTDARAQIEKAFEGSAATVTETPLLEGELHQPDDRPEGFVGGRYSGKIQSDGGHSRRDPALVLHPDGGAAGRYHQHAAPARLPSRSPGRCRPRRLRPRRALFLPVPAKHGSWPLGGLPRTKPARPPTMSRMLAKKSRNTLAPMMVSLETMPR